MTVFANHNVGYCYYEAQQRPVNDPRPRGPVLAEFEALPLVFRG